jgi:8-oxo-dGTP diphosphatase
MILATLCYVKRKGRTLMLERSKQETAGQSGNWNGLGGKFKPSETPEECVRREVREESGLAIQHPALVGILTFPAFKNEEDWYVYVFVARRFKGRMRESREGRLEWFDDRKMTKLDLWEGDKYFLKWIEQGRFFSGKFIYRHGKYIKHSVVFHRI